MDRFSIDTTLTKDDWFAYCMAAGARAKPVEESLRFRVLKWLPTALIVILLILAVLSGPLGLPRYAALSALIAVGLVVWTFLQLYRVRTEPADDGIFIGPVRVEISPDGIRMRRARYESFAAWSPAIEVTATPTHVFVWLDKMTAQVLPIRDLGALESKDVSEAIRGFIAGAGAAIAGPAATVMPQPLAAPAAPAAPTTPPKPSVAQEVLQVLKLWHVGAVDSRKLYGRDLTIILLSASALVLSIVLEYFSLDGTPEIAWWDLGGFAWTICFGLALAWLLARIARPRIPIRRTLLLVAGFAPLAAIGFGVAEYFGRLGYFIACGILAFDALIFFPRGLRAISGTSQRIAFFAGAACVGLVMYLPTSIYMHLSFWYVPDPEIEAKMMPHPDREQVGYEQPLKIERALAQLARADGVKSQMFFVGFAGYGEQRVFAGEIDLAAQRVDARYGTPRRALRLVNDRRDFEKYPLASVPALRHTLTGIAHVMNPEEDVLFLAISSHGSEDASISVQNGVSFFSDLHAAELASMLRESGIRWKVIVISACYAGSFVDALKDEQTIVITAAAKDRTSFGCSDDRDLTYFGETFYRDALPGAKSLREAFERTRAQIAQREKDEGISASDPQAFFGTAIEAKLAK